MTDTVEQLLATGQQFYAAGAIIEAELQARRALARNPDSPEALHLAGLVAHALGRVDVACARWERALAVSRGNRAVSDSLAIARGELEGWRAWQADEAQRERYVLVKPWSAGFFSEVDHVMGWCLLAEITGRMPVVHWGEGFFFSDDPTRDAFADFFVPVSPVALTDLAHRGFWFYPLKWGDDNLAQDDRRKTLGPVAERSVLSYLSRAEDVLVADYFCRPAELVDWIPDTHPWHGMSVTDVNRAVVARYLRPAPGMAERVESFVQERFAGRPVVAVHVRAGDKIREDKDLWMKIAAYPEVVDALRATLGGDETWVYLLTDSERVLEQYRERYGEHLVASDSVRTRKDDGVHFERHDSRRRLGEEVLFDALVAARCDAFVGNGTSNVSCFVHSAKAWPPERCHLFGEMRHLTAVPTWTYPIPVIRRPDGVA